MSLPSLFLLCISVPNYHSPILLVQQRTSAFLIWHLSFHITLALFKLINTTHFYWIIYRRNR